MDKKLLYDLSDLNYKILYLPEYDWYIETKSFKNYNPSNHIHENKISGKDISSMIDNNVVARDQHSIATYIEGLKERNWTFDKDLKYIWLT